VVDSLPCTILGIATKRIKESDLVVTQPSNNFGRLYNLEIQIQHFGNPKTTVIESGLENCFLLETKVNLAQTL
jgi:hypothetical protein